MITDILTLPDEAILSPPRSPDAALQQSRIWERAQHLFQPAPSGKPTPDYDYRCDADPADPTFFFLYKPRGEVIYGDYTEHRYVYNAREQTCSCPFFCGIEPGHWTDTFRVIRLDKKVVVLDRDNQEVKQDKPSAGYCKHHLGFLCHVAQTNTLPPDKDGVCRPIR